MSQTNKIILLVVGLAVAFAVGRFTTPKKVEIVEEVKTVEVEVIKEVIKEVKSKETDTQKNTTTIITETILPDGTKITETKIVNNDQIKEKEDSTLDKETDSSTSKEFEWSKVVKKDFQNNNWRVSALAYSNKMDLNGLSYGAIVERRVLGPIYIGGMGTTDKTFGVSLGLSF